MGRPQITYSEKELTRPAKYIIAVCDPNIDTHIVDMEEAQNYVNKYNRRAIIVSSKEVFRQSEIEQLRYLFIVNVTIPSLKLIDPNGQSYKVVYSYISEKFKNGLIIAHSDTITHVIADELAQNKNNGLDFIIYRQDLMSLSPNEKTRMNYIRFHFNPEFNFSKSYFTNYCEVYGTHSAIGIFTCQYIANAQYNACQSYFKQYSNILEKQGSSDFVNYLELNRQNAFYVYYDFLANKIFEFSKEKIKYYMELMFKAIDHKPLFNKAGELSQMYFNV
jgi:hypothetical protein